MSSSRAHVRHHYHPVGQGLFCTGEFTSIRPIAQRFFWVHDCGATFINQSDLLREVDRVRTDIGPSHKIDLLILSHFDADHIAGLRALLPGITVEQVVLPYMAPSDRILLAMQATEDGDPAFAEFLYDPPGFLASLAGEGTIRTVTYIGGPDNAPEITNIFRRDVPPFVSDAEREAIPVTMTIGFDDVLLDEIDPPFRRPGDRHPQVQHAPSSTRLFVGAGWEFLFHNKPAWQGNLPALRTQVDDFLAKVDAGALALPEAINHIRAAYRASEQFGSSPVGRNEISLITYAGPAEPSGVKLRVFDHHASLWPVSIGPIARCWTVPGSFRRPDKPAGLLYTGDLTLDVPLRQIVRTKWKEQRWRRIGFVQMPHHGANLAWQETDPSQWHHRHSVFSYGIANSYGHPATRLLNVMHGHGPLLVNEHQGASWSCKLEWISAQG